MLPSLWLQLGWSVYAWIYQATWFVRTTNFSTACSVVATLCTKQQQRADRKGFYQMPGSALKQCSRFAHEGVAPVADMPPDAL